MAAVAPENDPPRMCTVEHPNAAVCNAFGEIPGLAVGVLTEDLRYEYVNETGAHLLGLQCSAAAIGHAREEFVGSEESAAMRLKINLAVESGRPVVERAIWDGRQVITTIVPTRDEEGRLKVLVVARAHVGLFDPATIREERFNYIDCDAVNLGKLDCLTPREVEVLALMGDGRGRTAIAEELGRSPKTIDNHFMRISSKLGTRDRGALIALAARAGLMPADGRKRRISEQRLPDVSTL